MRLTCAQFGTVLESRVYDTLAVDLSPPKIAQSMLRLTTLAEPGADSENIAAHVRHLNLGNMNPTERMMVSGPSLPTDNAANYIGYLAKLQKCLVPAILVCKGLRTTRYAQSHLS